VRPKVSVPARRTRPPAAAGSFYPAHPDALRSAIRAAFEGGRRPDQSAEASPSALVVPHAGYQYSGPVAASAYLALGEAPSGIRRVVLLGPSHFVPVRGLALSGMGAFETPLGLVPLDEEARRSLLSLPQCVLREEAHAGEHSLEVQLPFLQTCLSAFELVPLAVGDARPAEVAEAIEPLWSDPGTLVVVSTDLSHYLDRDAAMERDARTARAVQEGDPEAVADHDACGARPLRGLMAAAACRGLRPELLDLRTSADSGGPSERVVGYGAFVYRGRASG